MKTLKQMLEVYDPKPGDEKKFKEKHVAVKHKNLAGKSTEDDQLFQATNVKTVNREPTHGYNPGNDEKVYEETSIEEGIEDRLEAAREKAAAAGKTIKQPQQKKTLKRFVAGKAYGGSKQKEDQEDMKEEVEILDEAVVTSAASKILKQHHGRIKDLLKGIGAGVDEMKKNAGDNPHFGHVRQLNMFANQLQDIHDGIHAEAQYSKPVQLAKEEIELVNELKTSTLQSYQVKSSDAYKKAAVRARNAPLIADPDSPEEQKQAAKEVQKQKQVMAKRKTGYMKAGAKIKAAGEKPYMAEEALDEKKLTPAEMKKREEVARAIERENPKMPMGKKMAIATATAKKVAEEASPKTLKQLLEGAMVTLHVKPHPDQKGHHVVVKSSDTSRFKKGETVSSDELEQGQDDGYLKVKHVKE